MVGLNMDLNIPTTSEASIENETNWLSVKDLKVGDKLTMKIERIHLGEKAVVFFSPKNDALSLFHTSDFDGQTLGERSLIALGQALKVEGETTAESLIEQASSSKKLSITVSNEAFEKDGEARTYKRISFKV